MTFPFPTNPPRFIYNIPFSSESATDETCPFPRFIAMGLAKVCDIIVATPKGKKYFWKAVKDSILGRRPLTSDDLALGMAADAEIPPLLDFLDALGALTTWGLSV